METEPKPEQSPQDPKGMQRYLGLGVQILATLGIFLAAGWWLDKHFALATPWFTVGLSLFGIVSIMIWVVVRFGRK
jgi:ATP synthase protein I